MSSEIQDPRALLVSVSFRSATDLRTLLENLKRLKGFLAVRVMIADNASGAEAVAAIRRMITGLTNVELLESPINRGYFGGARLALSHHLAQVHRLPDWVIVCNPDAVVKDPEFLEKLFQLDPDSLGVVAPQIVVPCLRLNQNPFMKKRPGRLRRFTMRLNSHDYLLSVAWDWLSRVKRVLHSKLRMTQAAKETAIDIYAPHGSFLIFSRKYFEAGGYLDDQLFLFGEEISVGEICHRLGLRVAYDPTLTVIHNEHQSTGAGMNRAKFDYHRQSIHHVLSKYLIPQPKLGDNISTNNDFHE